MAPRGNPVGLQYPLIAFGLISADIPWQRERISRRFDLILKAGLIEELVALKSKYNLHPDLPSMRSVGYRQAWEYLEGCLSLEDLRERGIIATAQLAKRQRTWLRGFDWVTPVDPKLDGCMDSICRHLDSHLTS